MAADPPPDDVRTLALRAAVFEGRSSVRCPGHLEDGFGALDAPDAEAGTEGTLRQVAVKLR